MEKLAKYFPNFRRLMFDWERIPKAADNAPKPEPYPWLYFEHDEKGWFSNDDKKEFYNIFYAEKNKEAIKSLPQLNNKLIYPCGHGWFLLLESKTKGGRDLQGRKVEEIPSSLWNPVTLKSIKLPSLLLLKDRGHSVVCSILSSSPVDNHDSSVIVSLTSSSAYMLKFCEVGDQEWKEMSITNYRGPDRKPYLNNLTLYNGKIYALESDNSAVRRLVAIDQNLGPDGCGQLETFMYSYLTPFDSYESWDCKYLVESCGELFLICLSYENEKKLCREVDDFGIWKLEFSKWRKVESVGDRVFFLDKFASYSCPVIDPETQGHNCIYLINNEDTRIFCLNTQEKTLSVSIADLNLEHGVKNARWLLPEFKLVERESDANELKLGEEEKAKEKNIGEIEKVNVCNLPLDMKSVIGNGLELGDHINFGTMSKTFRLAAPARPPTSCWLMIYKIGEDIITFLDPVRLEKYQMHNRHKSDKVRMYCSNQGWCLMVREHRSIFFWNPFSTKMVELPQPPLRGEEIVSATFSSSPKSPDCVVILFTAYNYYDHRIFSLRKGRWKIVVDSPDCRKRKFNEDYRKHEHNNTVFYKDHTFIMGNEGNLSASTQHRFSGVVFLREFIKSPIKPKAIKESYLLEGDGKLLCVIVGFMGKWLRIFELDLSRIIWIEVKSIGDLVIYVSPLSSFSMIATTEKLKNKVFLPKIFGNSMICYCLTSKRFYSYGSGNVLKDLCHSKKQLYSCWIQPMW